MPRDFKLQDPGEGIHEVEIREVLVSAGDEVEEGQNVLVVESDKAAVEIPSPYSGKIEEVAVEQGQTVEVGELLIRFADGEDAEEGAPEAEAEAEKKEADEEEEAPGKRRARGRAKTKETDREAADEGKEEEDKEEDEDEGKEEAGKEGATGEKQARGRAKPEKPDREAEEVGEEREATAAESRREEGERPAKAKRERPEGAPVPATPAVRRLARDLDVDLHDVTPSGPDGRVLREDVEKAAEGAAARKPAAGLPDFAQWGEVERKPLRSIRRATARQMARSWAEIPHVTHQDLADVTALEALRQRQRARVEQAGGKLTLTAFALKAAATALREFPRFNASLDAEAEEIVLKRYCHIGVAVDTEQGLLVPVLRDVDRKSVFELAVELTELAERTRQGKATKEELRGGSFTLTNVGPLGGTAFAPIINHPQVAILGLAAVRTEPVVEGTSENVRVVPRLHLPLCVAFDHRVIDGAEAARFTSQIRQALSDPERFALTV